MFQEETIASRNLKLVKTYEDGITVYGGKAPHPKWVLADQGGEEVALTPDTYNDYIEPILTGGDMTLLAELNAHYNFDAWRNFQRGEEAVAADIDAAKAQQRGYDPLTEQTLNQVLAGDTPSPATEHAVVHESEVLVVDNPEDVQQMAEQLREGHREQVVESARQVGKTARDPGKSSYGTIGHIRHPDIARRASSFVAAALAGQLAAVTAEEAANDDMTYSERQEATNVLQARLLKALGADGGRSEMKRRLRKLPKANLGAVYMVDVIVPGGTFPAQLDERQTNGYHLIQWVSRCHERKMLYPLHQFFGDRAGGRESWTYEEAAKMTVRILWLLTTKVPERVEGTEGIKSKERFSVYELVVQGVEQALAGKA